MSALARLSMETLETLEQILREERARREAASPPRRAVRQPVDPGPVDDLARARARAALARAGVPVRRGA